MHRHRGEPAAPPRGLIGERLAPCAVVVPIVSSGLWDLSGLPAIVFVPVAVCTIAIVILAPSIVLREKSA
jgi:hypothetical protein